ncbi:MAG: LptF/LptG family permease [Phycisphaerales bacterium JB039]
MGLLDRYIARQYLFNIVALLVILFCFVVTVDVSLNLDRYLRVTDNTFSAEGVEPGSAERIGRTAWLIFDLWWPRLLQLFNFTLGLALVGAMGFTCAQLVRRRELVAVLASGQSLRRVGRPIMLVAAAFVALQIANQEIVLPQIAPLLTRDPGQAGQRTLGSTRVPLTTDGAGNIFYARSFDVDREIIEDLTVWIRSPEGHVEARIEAESARWGAGGWDLTGATITPIGAAAAQPAPVAHLTTALDPTTLKMRQFRGLGQNLSWRRLGQMLDRDELMDDDTRDRLTRLRLGRLTIWAGNLLTLVVAMPFFLTRVPSNMAVQSLKCAPITIGVLIASVLGASIDIPGAPAAVGVFVPLMILAPLAVASASAIRT